MSDIDSAIHEKLLNTGLNQDTLDVLSRKSLISKRCLNMLLNVDEETFSELMELPPDRSSELSQIRLILEGVLEGNNNFLNASPKNRRSSIRSSINSKDGRRMSLSQQLSSDLAFLENAASGDTNTTSSSLLSEDAANTPPRGPSHRSSIRSSMGKMFSSSKGEASIVEDQMSPVPPLHSVMNTPRANDMSISESLSPARMDDIIRDLCATTNSGSTLCGKISRLTGGFKPWTSSQFEFDKNDYCISYQNKEESTLKLWLDETVVAKKLCGTYFQRTNCLLVDWKKGSYFLLLSFDTFIELNNFFNFLCDMIDVCKLRETSESKRLRVLRNLHLRSAMSSKQGMLGKIRSLDVRVMESSGLNTRLYFVPENVMCCEEFTFGYSYAKYASGSAEALSHDSLISNYHRNSFLKLCNRFPDRHQEEIRRFFTSKKYNYMDSEQALLKHIKWRLSNLPVDFSDVKGELDTGKCYCYGHDYDGCPVIYIHEGRLDVNNPLVSNDDLTIRGFIYRLEQAIGKIPHRDGKVTVVINRLDADERHFNLNFLTKVASVFRNHYPGRLSKAIVIPVSSSSEVDSAGVKKRLKLVKTLLCSGVLNKVKFLEGKEELLQLIPADQLLAELGGNNFWSFQRHISKESSVMEPFLWTDPQLSVDYYPTGQFGKQRVKEEESVDDADDETHAFMEYFGRGSE